MTILVPSTRTRRWPSFSRPFLAVMIALTALAPVEGRAEHDTSAGHEVHFDGATEKQYGKKLLDELTTFFHNAEVAIATKDMDKVMAVYSDNYINGPHDKASLIPIWERIFKNFDKLYTKHNMRIVTESKDSPVMIIRCSGILMGTPVDGNEAMEIALDYWINSDHILAKEDGVWRLIGSTGKEQKRFGFDKPIHPLF